MVADPLLGIDEIGKRELDTLAEEESAEYAFELDTLRRRGVMAMLVPAWVVTLFLLGLSLSREPSVLWAVGLSALLNAYPTWLANQGQFSWHTRCTLVLNVVIQPLLVYVVMEQSGLPPQFPLAYFIAVVTIAFMCDTKALILGTVLCSLQLIVLCDPRARLDLLRERRGLAQLAAHYLGWP